jgi:hypothetical protein
VSLLCCCVVHIHKEHDVVAVSDEAYGDDNTNDYYEKDDINIIPIIIRFFPHDNYDNDGLNIIPNIVRLSSASPLCSLSYISLRYQYLKI